MMEILKEKWTQYAALTTTILAVCAAISALKGGGYSTRVQVTTTMESNAWAYFQSKSTKQHMAEVGRDTLVGMKSLAKDPAAKQWFEKKIPAYDADVARYDREKNEIKAKAESFAKESEYYKFKGGYFGLAVMLLQIAIMLSSVGALLKKPVMWVGGLTFGVIGLGYMVTGFLV